eukprot:CAMPEP_0116880272 /NCGR_PEP_ID=MMETSP0463-20121206/12180_1 /TAXON_ID=181622 /ORGANISM="Strombidinopsis sp, Strain SopsisLIS2011" /LENGTH=128 /DNA_ID=CAMNT_0004530643 /DNA_START=233 /DNA_END=619 /DNA_ORIENTATION=-
MIQDTQNANYPARKPMPPALKKEFSEKSKEYHAYKIAEHNLVKKEEAVQLKASFEALDAVFFLPDYLMDECLNETGVNDHEDMGEFRPAQLYIEQTMRLFPREITHKFKLIPAFEETLMKIEESRESG